MKAWTLGEPAPNELGFVRTVVVQNEMNLKLAGHVVIDGVEKLPELS